LLALKDRITAFGTRRVVLLGLAFKSHTDDLRESPFVELAMLLAADRRQVVCVDATIASTQLFGVNRDLFNAMTVQSKASIAWSPTPPAFEDNDAVVLCTDHPAHVAAMRSLPGGHRAVLDLTGRHLRTRGRGV
jgi:GDP-mannose 6-dehydrogenase